jgi:dihydrofolate reductase
MALVGIVAIDRNRSIGKSGALPWHYSSDMEFFKQQTTGHVCVMGRNTWRSFKKPLPNRLNVVLSRSAVESVDPSVLIVSNADFILRLAEYLRDDIFIIGGARIYEAFVGHISRWIVTEVPLAVDDADTFMPATFLTGFRVRETRDLGEGLIAKFYERGNEAIDGADRMD